MICPHCADGGDLTAQPAPQLKATRAIAVQAHAKCFGCDCQHKVPPLEVLAQRRAAMPRGGLARIVDILTTGSD
jgi:hypothetical protein